MNIQQQDQPLHDAQAAARRLLVRTIDLRFDLDDAADAIGRADSVSPVDLRRLRADADALCREIDRLAEALWSPLYEASFEDDEVDEAAATA